MTMYPSVERASIVWMKAPYSKEEKMQFYLGQRKYMELGILKLLQPNTKRP